MKTPNKKLTGFRIDARLFEQLEAVCRTTGIDRTEIVERALQAYFSKGMKQAINDKIIELQKVAASFNPPTLPMAA